MAVSRLNMMKDVESFSILKDRPRALLRRIKGTKRAISLTVDGAVVAVLLNAAEYQRLMDLASFVDADDATRQMEEEMARLGEDYWSE